MNKNYREKFIARLWIIAVSCLVGLWGENIHAFQYDPFGSQTNLNKSAPPDITLEGPYIENMEFSNEDINTVFYAVSSQTGWNIIPSSAVSNAKVTLWVKKLTAQQLLDTVVQMAGFIYHRQGNLIKVMTYDEYMQYVGLAKNTIPLKYAAAASVETTIKQFLSKLGKSVVHKQTNSIVLYDTKANLKFVLQIIETLDKPSSEIIAQTVHLQHCDCAQMALILKNIFGTKQNPETAKNKSIAAVNDGISADDPQNPILNMQNNNADLVVSFDPVEIYPVTHANQLVVVGYKYDIEKVKHLVAQMDVAGENLALEVVDIEFADAQELARTVQNVFAHDNSPPVNNPPLNTPAPLNLNPPAHKNQNLNDLAFDMQGNVAVFAMGRTNQLIIKSFKNDLKRIKTLVRQLDTYVEATTQNYHFVYVDAADIYQGLERILYAARGYQRMDETQKERHLGLTLLQNTNSIVLTGPPSFHRIMASTREMADVPVMYEEGVIKSYKVYNVDVNEVAAIISDLIITEEKLRTDQAQFQEAQIPPRQTDAPQAIELTQTGKLMQQVESKVSVSTSTNSIIVQTTARKHRELEKLIRELDQKRLEVLIDAFIVEITTTDNLDLGIELDKFFSTGLAFTSFGLASIDPTTGAREVIASPGGTAAILDPDTARAVIKALQSSGNTRIQSTPRLLVNDNAPGAISSVAEEPVTQINASNTVATTSFQQYVQAGTQFNFVPHISKNDYLRVEYIIELNAFGPSSADASVPPPRSTSRIQSEATIPDGYTVIVGGVQSINDVQIVNKVPLLGDIPLLGLLFQSASSHKQYKTTYLFMTPTIMKDADFSDLKNATRNALQQVQNHNKTYPQTYDPYQQLKDK